ncbi:unnamed protein product [Medioppia subpectinata]|uniref:G-protein coupled receptors family 2 profile 1 domain-containing protein n=1 Tax=Medioppia subpectinata TaxID=1979941 RepID=A0A7R9LBV1_9ACAR|nr:unnamed protein product [Medioppia subpectinata]CAG2117597.1 unnamed protein product [Medioppia subpectinata]
MCSEVKSKSSVTPSQYFRAFINCTQTAISTPKGWHQNLSYCSSNFDGIGCWNAALPDNIMTISCPDYIPGSKALNNATRKCLLDGKWEFNDGKDEADYSECDFDANFQTLDENQLNEIFEEMVKLDPSPYSDINTAHAFEDCIDRVLVGPKTQSKS